MLILCAVIAMVGALFLAVAIVRGGAEKVAGLEALWSIDSIEAMMLSEGKVYRTRCGWPVIRMMRDSSPDEEKSDGFPWKVWYRTDKGEYYGWYNDDGRWSNNPWYKTTLDIVESK